MKAVAYLRTSSATNVGHDKDSAKRQREAIAAYAIAFDIHVETEFYDEAVSGADPVQDRPGFANMLQYLADNEQVVKVLVENASRFARDLAVQIAGHDLLRQRGITLVPVDAPDYFVDETPTAVMVRQILGAVSEFEKSNLVYKLRSARERVRAERGKCEGRRSHLELSPCVVQQAVSLRERCWTYRAIAAELADRGHLNLAGKPFTPGAIGSMLKQARNRLDSIGTHGTV